MVSNRISRQGGPLLRLLAVGFIAALLAVDADPAAAQALALIKVACLGEASTHSAHRMYDPEYPELMGVYLDSTTFKVEPSPANPAAGGMLYGAGATYRIGNFGVPTGAVIETNLADPQSMITSAQLKAAEAFAPHIVILGPFGPHEALTNANLDTFLPSLRRLVARVVAFPSKPTVYVALPLPRWGMDGEANRRRFNMETAQVIRETALPSIDFWTAFLGKMPEFADQNHLNLAGRTHMAQVAGAVIKTWRPAGGADGGVSGPDGGAVDSGGATADAATDSRGNGGGTGSSNGGSTGASTTGGTSGASSGGASGTGGAIGTGGDAAGTGGAIGTGGTVVSGSTGGSAAGTGGRPASGSDAAAGGAVIDTAPGCGCAMGNGATHARSGWALLLAFASAGAMLTRRPSRRRKQPRHD